MDVMKKEYRLGEVVEVERRPRAGAVISVRLSSDEAGQLQRIAEQRGSTVSRVARDALVDFLHHGSTVTGIRAWPGLPWTGTTDYGNNLVLLTSSTGQLAMTVGPVQQPVVHRRGVTSPTS